MTSQSQIRPVTARMDQARVVRPRPAWLLADKGRGREGATKAAAATFTYNVDNRAEASWRTREPPLQTVKIPAELLAAQHDFVEIARQADAFVFPYTGDGKGIFGIWANTPEQANVAKQNLIVWIRRETASKNSLGTSNFTKIRSLNEKQLVKAEKRWIKEVNRHRFRQTPPAGTAFEAIGTFEWTSNVTKPKAALGPGFEALDNIRMDTSCFIVAGDNDSYIHALGNLKDVQAAITRIRKTFFQLNARQLKPARLHLMHWDTSRGEPQRISLSNYIRPAYLGLSNAEQSKDVTYQAAKWNNNSAEHIQPSKSVATIRAAINDTIKKLHYYNASIRFRVRLGTFVATSYMRPSDGAHTIEEFSTMIGQSQFAGNITQEIGHAAIEHRALAVLQNASAILQPHDLMTHDLADVLPTYSATFEFDLADHVYLLAMSWQELIEYGSNRKVFVSTPNKWTKLDQATGSANQLLDIKLMRLDSGMAWHFDMQASNVVSEDRLPDKLRSFASRVRFNETATRSQTASTPFVAFMAGESKLKSLKCSSTYSFRLANSDYVLELSRFQTWEYSAIQVRNNDPDTMTTEPRWRVTVHHMQWDKLLSENGSISIGEGTTWDDEIATWLPDGFNPSSKGIDHLMDTLEKVELIIKQ